MHTDRFTGLQAHLRVKDDYYLEAGRFPTATQFFRTVRSGMWMVLGRFRGFPHWFAFDAWRRTIFEGENHVLAKLEPEDLKDVGLGCPSPIENLLEHLELSELQGYVVHANAFGVQVIELSSC